jgi:hypothetical protein
MKVVVERVLDVRLVLSPERSVPVPALLSYRRDDPFAVHFTFHLGTEAPVTWVFARDLLIEGIFRACGHGDVRVWPTRLEDAGVVCLALSSPAGDALLELPSAGVADWLEETLRLVPSGREGRGLDLDAGLAELLAGS